MRKIALISLAVGCVAFAFGCSDDTKNKKVDIGTVKVDKKPVQLDGNGPGIEGTVIHKEGSVTNKDTGPFDPTGYGDSCDPQSATSTCPAALDCVGIQGMNGGWCSAKCDPANAGKICPGMPLASGNYKGAAAYCALCDSGKTQCWCLFVCAIGGKTLPCPTDLVCAPATYDMGTNTQRECTPKS